MTSTSLRASPREEKTIRVHQFLRDIQRTHVWYSVLGAVVLGLLSVGDPAIAGGDGAVRLLTTIPVPVSPANNTAGAMYSFDISWVDQRTHTYYLADRSNRVVDIVEIGRAHV